MPIDNEFQFAWHLRSNKDLLFGADAELSRLCLDSAQQNAIDCIKDSRLDLQRKKHLIHTAMHAWVDATLMLLYEELDRQEAQKEHRERRTEDVHR